MSDFPVVSPVAAAVASAVGSAVTGSDSGRWYLHWGGVNQYAQHSPWSMSGFGDRIEFSFVADAVDVWHKINGTADQKNLIRITDTGVLQVSHLDIDGTTQRWISGPTCSVGTVYSGSVTFNADGVVLTVNGTEYTGGFVPYPLKNDYNSIAAIGTPTSYFKGTIHYLRYVNATALQGVNAVQGNGVDLYGVIPEITLTGDFEIELDHISALYSAANYRIIGSNASNRMRYSTASSGQLAITISGVSGAIDDVLPSVAGEHGRLIVSRTAGEMSASWCGVPGSNTLSIPGDFVISKIYTADSVPLPAGAVLGNLKITDKSGASDVVYQYDLSGDSGSNIPITIDGVASTPGTWQNYDSGTDQVALPVLSRNYRMNDGPDALFLEDANHPLGPELVVNGGFDSDTSVDWLAGLSGSGASSVAHSGGVMRVTQVTANFTTRAYAVTTVVGKTYVLTATYKANSTSRGNIRKSDAQASNTNVVALFNGVSISVSDVTASVFFTATATTTYIHAGTWNEGNGTYAEYDNVSVKCIETGAQLVNVSPEDWDRSKS